MSHLALTYGYLAVFGLITAEYIGVPVPAETALIVATAYAGHTHRLSAWLILVLAVVAAILGDYLGYLAGLKGGYRLLLRWGPVIRLDHAKIKVGWYVFDRHGGKVVFFGRFVTVLRTYAVFLAGTNRMRSGRFSLFNVAGGVAWAVIYTFVSYSAGQLLTRLSTFITIIGLAVAAVMVTVVTLLMRRGAARLTARAEAAFPGPLAQVAPGSRPIRKPPVKARPATADREPLWMSDSQSGPCSAQLHLAGSRRVVADWRQDQGGAPAGGPFPGSGHRSAHVSRRRVAPAIGGQSRIVFMGPASQGRAVSGWWEHRPIAATGRSSGLAARPPADVEPRPGCAADGPLRCSPLCSPPSA